MALATTISDLSLWVEQAFGLVLFDPAVYYIGGLPSTLLWGMFWRWWRWPSAEPAGQRLSCMAGRTGAARRGAQLCLIAACSRLRAW
ncbi:MAG: hypothetical protein CM15mP103_10350 [Gammaproteobacteria bacterium]|nr:MAG: hypothetical protein CM15mP103_10350 [Gammaproteobacteria bacterium]